MKMCLGNTVVCLLVLLFVPGGMVYLGTNGEAIYPWITNQVTSTATVGKIVSSDYGAVSHEGGALLSVPMRNTYRIKIRYTYLLNKKQYTGTRYSAESDEFASLEKAESIARSYSPGTDAKVWYNPHFPDFAVLHPHVGVRRLVIHLVWLGIAFGLSFLAVRYCINVHKEGQNGNKQ
jgi:hypothetical protein